MTDIFTISSQTLSSAVFSTPANTADALQLAGRPNPDANAAVVRALEKDIQRIQGFNTNLSPAKNRRLAEIRADIESINAKRSSNPSAKARQEAQLLKLNTEAFKILGKKFVDFEGPKLNLPPAENRRLNEIRAEIASINSNPSADPQERQQQNAQLVGLNAEAFRILGKTLTELEGEEKLKEVKDKIDTLLEPPLRGEKKARLERLRKLSETALGDFLNRGSSSALRRLDNIERQIALLVPPRIIGELTVSERREYDALVKQGNDIAGTEAFLPSKKLLQIEKIQATIARLS